MNAQHLLLPDGTPSNVAFCGECGLVYGRTVDGENFPELAERCCRPVLCACGEPCGRMWTICDACRSREAEERDQARWDAATKVDGADYDGMVWNEWDDTFHDDLDAFIEAWQDEHVPGDPLPRVYACRSERTSFNAEQIIEHAFEDAYEDALDGMPTAAYEEMQAALDAWAAKHGVTTYQPDYTRAILWTPDPEGWQFTGIDEEDTP